MKLDADVIRDLLPLYVAGEASPATRALVEQALTEHPELARLAREMAAGEGALTEAARGAAPAADGERRALAATRRLLRLRSVVLGLGIATTLLPLSVRGGADGVHFLVLGQAPWLAIVSWASAAVCWLVYWRVSRRLRVTGL